eukprot:SAG11_NODE_4578_length_1844_cov_3.409742_2_plen_144_part_00
MTYDSDQYHEAVSHGKIDLVSTRVPVPVKPVPDTDTAFEKTKLAADAMRPNPHIPKFTTDEIETAIKNYESYHKLPKGSVSVNQVERSSAGVYGWKNYKPLQRRKPKQVDERKGALNCMTHKYTMNYLAAASKPKKKRTRLES